MRLPILSGLLCLAVATARGHDPEAELPFERPHVHGALVGHVHLGWESRYVLEGRDSLDGDSLWATSVEVAREHFSGGVWYGNSPDGDYDELQFTVALTQAFGDLELYCACTHLRFPSDGFHDNEAGLGLAWSGLPLELELTLDAYYSFEVDGLFSELGLGREFELAEGVRVGFSGVFGVNQGYVPDGHDGANHLALRLGAEIALVDSLSLAGHVAYSWALDKNPSLSGDALLVDFFHGGVSLQWTF